MAAVSAECSSYIPSDLRRAECQPMDLPLTPQKRQASVERDNVQQTDACSVHPMLDCQVCAPVGDAEKQAESARDDDGGVVASPVSPGGASRFTADNSERETPVFHDDQGSTAPTDCSFSWSTLGKPPCYSPTGTRYSDEQQQQQQQQQQDHSAELETSGKTSPLYCTLQVLLPPIFLKYLPLQTMDVDLLASIRGFWGSLSTRRVMLQELLLTCFCFALAIVRLVISLFPKENAYTCWLLDRTERLMPSSSASKTDFSTLQWPLRLGPISVSSTGIDVQNEMRRVLQDFFVRGRDGVWLRVKMTIGKLTAWACGMLDTPSLQALGAKVSQLNQQSVQHLQKYSLPVEGFLTVFHAAGSSDSSGNDKRRSSFWQRLQTLSEGFSKQALALKGASASWPHNIFSFAGLKDTPALAARVQGIVSLFLQWVTGGWDSAVRLKDSFSLYMAELIATCGEGDSVGVTSTWLKPRWGMRGAARGSWIFGCATRHYAPNIREGSHSKND